MKIDIITIFPEMFEGAFSESMIKRAQVAGVVKISIHNLRKWTDDNHKSVDDKPYGGGPGMVMKVEPIDKAISEIKENVDPEVETKVVLLTPQGKQYKQGMAHEYSGLQHLILICGHYEGFDERIRELVDVEVSIGDYILTCGEIPAMVLCDSIVRLLSGVLGDEKCLDDESFEENFLEYPQYTRPSVYKDMKVPEVLINGDHKKIKMWQEEQSLKRTKERRPDLVGKENN